METFWYIVEVIIQLGWLGFIGFLGVTFCWIVTLFVTQKDGEPDIPYPEPKSSRMIWAVIGMAILLMLLLPERLWVITL